MIKLQPFDPATRTQIQEKDVEEWKEHVKAGLHESIRDKVVYQDMNKRRTIYNLGLRLTTKEEIDQLHEATEFYKSEYQFFSATVPFSPLEYINDPNAPAEETQSQSQNQQAPSVSRTAAGSSASPAVHSAGNSTQASQAPAASTEAAQTAPSTSA